DNTALSAADLSTFIDYCGAKNVNVMINMYYNVDLTSINNNKTKKALIGYFSDDSNRYTAAQMQTRENTIKGADINHLHIATGSAGDLTNNLSLSQSFASITDGWICQWYPVSTASSINSSYGVFTKAEDVVCAPNGGISGPFIQIYNWQKSSSDRFPTAMEGRAMIYNALIAGSKSLWFYTFRDYQNNSTVNLSQPALWNETKNVSTNLKNILGTVILNGTLSKNITTNSSYVKASYWNYNGDTYLIAVNSNNSPVSATISYDAIGKTVSAMLSDIPGTLTFNSSTKQLTGTMQPMEVQAIKLKNINTGINSLNDLDYTFQLYPNPASENVIISYQLANNSEIKIFICDMLGKEVMQIANEKQNSGEHSLNVNTTELNNGIYFIKVIIGGQETTEKLIVN
nr:T9SS type A sorting domain-containing protein [Bacteroidota bacterium]